MSLNQGRFPESLQLRCIHGYRACTSFVDAQVGLLIDELEALGLSQDTVIVLWGDHGFHLGDHGMWGKHSTLEQATRVPLIIRPPAGATVHETAAPVEFTDLFPTLCELAAIPSPPSLHGRSLMPLIRGESDQVRNGALTVFRKRGALGYSYRTSRYRYTQWISKFGKLVAEDLYDYQSDPDETINLAASKVHEALRSKLSEQLHAEAQGCTRLRMRTR